MTILEIAFEEGKKAGKQEMVEFIGKEPFEHNYLSGGFIEGGALITKHSIDDCFACKWQAKLKEWGE